MINHVWYNGGTEEEKATWVKGKDIRIIYVMVYGLWILVLIFLLAIGIDIYPAFCRLTLLRTI